MAVDLKTIAPVTPLEAEEVEYPDSDGQGMPDGDPQRTVMEDVESILARRYAGDPNVYVSANNFVYYEEGDPTQVFSPDVMVVVGVPKHERDYYQVWNENDNVPDFVMEIAARTTFKKDLGEKKSLYRLLGIREFIAFDHTGGEYFSPPLQGFRLENRRYKPIHQSNRVKSEVLGIEFHFTPDGQLHLYDIASGKRLLTDRELANLAEAALARAAQLEAELDRLRAERGSLTPAASDK
ncbi:MAG: Uma2 family endonuclease [Chloroflexi bacterium]|nr:Uma2 family endonuclease [Chloroflexota bacterium]